MKEINKNNFCTGDVQKEIEKNRNDCLDILQNNKKHMQKFKEIYKEKFWIELTDSEALEYSVILLNFVKLIISNSRR